MVTMHRKQLRRAAQIFIKLLINIYDLFLVLALARRAARGVCVKIPNICI